MSNPPTPDDVKQVGRWSWRDPVLWLVVGLPLAAVIAGFLTLWIAMSHRDPLITEPTRAEDGRGG